MPILPTDPQPLGWIDYQGIREHVERGPLGHRGRFLQSELPYDWMDAYREMTGRPTEILRIDHGQFEYFYDALDLLVAQGVVPDDPNSESRLVVAVGFSAPLKRSRDDSRLRGWVGRTEILFGKEWDKGHFIAHSIGGAVEGIEANVFIQRRDMNRGWSVEGKKYRELEKYCCANPGTFCFSRPIYLDLTSRPAWVEFGLLTVEGQFRVEWFDNR
ncbi:MAG TPA: hypothetical protein VN851_07595 [Thermoanaerobaculia bacterium]|nr:hypothetical protein [Thermoanaerobaculia bacterium]